MSGSGLRGYTVNRGANVFGDLGHQYGSITRGFLGGFATGSAQVDAITALGGVIGSSRASLESIDLAFAAAALTDQLEYKTGLEIDHLNKVLGKLNLAPLTAWKVPQKWHTLSKLTNNTKLRIVPQIELVTF